MLWWEDGNIKLMIQDGRSQATQAESQLLIGSSMQNLIYYFLSIFREDVFNFFNTEFLDPLKGIEGFLCPGIDILVNFYNIATLFGASD